MTASVPGLSRKALADRLSKDRPSLSVNAIGSPRVADFGQSAGLLPLNHLPRTKARPIEIEPVRRAWNGPTPLREFGLPLPLCAYRARGEGVMNAPSDPAPLYGAWRPDRPFCDCPTPLREFGLPLPFGEVSAAETGRAQPSPHRC
jgi:hypothetical protein